MFESSARSPSSDSLSPPPRRPISPSTSPPRSTSCRRSPASRRRSRSPSATRATPRSTSVASLSDYADRRGDRRREGPVARRRPALPRRFSQYRKRSRLPQRTGRDQARQRRRRPRRVPTRHARRTLRETADRRYRKETRPWFVLRRRARRLRRTELDCRPSEHHCALSAPSSSNGTDSGDYMPHLTRTLALVAIVVAAVIGAGGFVALAQTTQSSQRTIGGPRSTTSAPTPPPLPLGDQSRPAQGAQRSTNVGGGLDVVTALARMPLAKRMAGTSRFSVYTGPRPPIPKLTDLLHHKARYRRSASGGTIVLTGTSAVPYLDDQTLSYAANVYWLCQNLKPTTTYRYLVFPPDGTAYTVSSRDYVNGGYKPTFTTDA